METERDALVPKVPGHEALPPPTVVHWGGCQRYLNPIMAVLVPLVLIVAATSPGRQEMLFACLIGFAVSLVIVFFPVRHTFAIEGDKITYVRYRFFGLNWCPLVRVFSRQVSVRRVLAKVLHACSQ